MEKHIVVAHKLHYSVPETYADIPAVVRYDNEDNSLRIFNVSKGGINIQDKVKPKKLKNLDTVIKLDEVYGFVYGSVSSRFWMMRIAMNMLLLDNSERAKRCIEAIKKKYQDDSLCKSYHHAKSVDENTEVK